MIKSEAFPKSPCRLLTLVLLSCSLLLVAGCGGCTEEDPQANAEKEEEKKKETVKENYENKPPVVFPGNYFSEIRTNHTKLGHWVTTDVRMIANNFNAQGELLARPFNGKNSSPSTVQRTNYFMQSVRPVSLPKEEWRNFEIGLYLPKNPDLKNAAIDFEFHSGTSGLLQHSMRLARTAMHNFQQHMVVLTNRPDAYTYVNALDCVVIPDVTYLNERFPPFYYVVRTRPNKDPISLPREALNWTTIAYLIWDDLEPDQLDAEQQQSLVDWLHFGGQLILSGPDCLDKLQSSFLAEYLPATFKGTRNLTQEDLSELNKHWAVPVKNNLQLKHVLKVDQDSPLIGLDFDPHPAASFVNNTGQIAIERQVGRGRVVATSFSLDEAPVIAWPSYRSFFNGCLLRKPARQFGVTDSETLTFKFVDESTHIMDPMLATALRYTSRDLSNDGTQIKANIGRKLNDNDPADSTSAGFRPPISAWGPAPHAADADRGFNIAGAGQIASSHTRRLEDYWHYGGYQHDSQAGNAGWNDQSGISNAARQTLINSAGITPPSSKFVLQMLAVYLVVLVPLNWLVFRMMGRVEWAWIAAPIIAVTGAFAVAKMASLDIGFVRSNTQVALLEVYNGHQRGHLTQYSALYTSLSTGYELELDNASAQALPFGLAADRFQKKEVMSPVNMHRTIANRLEDFQIQSNTTGLLHTEMMLDLGGSFRYDDSSSNIRLENDSSVWLQDAAILRRLPDSSLEFAWIGEMEPQDRLDDLQFQPVPNGVEADELRRLLYPEKKSVAQRIWRSLAEKHGDRTLEGHTSLPAELFREVPEIREQWDEFLPIVQEQINKTASALAAPQENPSVDYETFELLFINLHPSNKINVSQLLDAVIENLQMAPGETRLLGVTRQPLSNNQFNPASTQTDQETLVLIHLKRPPMLPAQRDRNLLSDFGSSRTSLDWEEDMDAFDEPSEKPDE